MSSTGHSEAALEALLPVPIRVRRLKTAKRIRLRLDEGRRELRLTCPLSMSRRRALAWAIDQREWIELQLARSGTSQPFAEGAVIPIEGVPVTIVWIAGAPRTPTLAGGELSLGGPHASIEVRVERFLKAHALATMSREVAEYAALVSVIATGVTVGDAATRWGSCSSQGRIRLNWRLIFAPPAIRRYVVAHEVAHLVHLDHGAQFRSLEARLYGPGLSGAKAELRDIGPRLRPIGRSS